MTVYKNSVLYSSLLAVGSLLIAGLLYIVFDETFWCNVFIGIFGSAFVTVLSAEIGYLVERKNAMSEFYAETAMLLNKLNHYQPELALEQKIYFFLEISEYNIVYWDRAFKKMDFFSKDNKQYIKDKIYLPLLNAYQKIGRYAENFRCHVNGTYVNENMMRNYVENIESQFFSIEEYITKISDTREDIRRSYKNKIMEKIGKELRGKYCDIQCWPKKATEDTEEEKNGQA